jgi:type IV pilus assembly protein PilE
MRKGFTLLEIIVVLIILGIIATLGFTQYTRVIEKGRTSEAKANLGTIRTMAVSQYQETGSYPDNSYLSGVLGLPTSSCNSSYYYRYQINSTNGTGSAIRCTSGGKQPDSSTAYTLSLTTAGVGSSSPAGWW